MTWRCATAGWPGPRCRRPPELRRRAFSLRASPIQPTLQTDTTSAWPGLSLRRRPGSSRYCAGRAHTGFLAACSQKPCISPMCPPTVWQGSQERFQAFPVQADDHLLSVCRYVERNPVRAGLEARAEQTVLFCQRQAFISGRACACDNRRSRVTYKLEGVIMIGHSAWS